MLVVGGVLAGCAYGPVFGAGAGFIVLAALSLFHAGELHRLNALSRLLICIANVVALPLLVLLNPVDVRAAAVMWPTMLTGGYVGARPSLRLTERVMRRTVVALGLVALAYLLLRVVAFGAAGNPRRQDDLAHRGVSRSIT